MNDKDIVPVQCVKPSQGMAGTPTATGVPEMTRWHSMIIESVPKTQQMRAKNFLAYIKTVPDKMNWNEEGQLVVGREVVDKSNILDLINYAVRDKLKRAPPDGWNEFVGALRHTNVPEFSAMGKMGQAALRRESASPFRGAAAKGRRTIGKQSGKGAVIGWQKIT